VKPDLATQNGENRSNYYGFPKKHFSEVRFSSMQRVFGRKVAQLARWIGWIIELSRLNGGEGGIRTHGTVSRTLAFEASTFNRSVTSPRWPVQFYRNRASRFRAIRPRSPALPRTDMYRAHCHALPHAPICERDAKLQRL